jgi:mono/diheme cytochrome c family protein
MPIFDVSPRERYADLLQGSCLACHTGDAKTSLV